MTQGKYFKEDEYGFNKEEADYLYKAHFRDLFKSLLLGDQKYNQEIFKKTGMIDNLQSEIDDNFDLNLLFDFLTDIILSI